MDFQLSQYFSDIGIPTRAWQQVTETSYGLYLEEQSKVCKLGIDSVRATATSSHAWSGGEAPRRRRVRSRNHVAATDNERARRWRRRWTTRFACGRRRLQQLGGAPSQSGHCAESGQQRAMRERSLVVALPPHAGIAIVPTTRPC